MAVIYKDVKIHTACVSEIQSNFFSIYKDLDNLFLLCRRTGVCNLTILRQALDRSPTDHRIQTERTHNTGHLTGRDETVDSAGGYRSRSLVTGTCR